MWWPFGSKSWLYLEKIPDFRFSGFSVGNTGTIWHLSVYPMGPNSTPQIYKLPSYISDTESVLGGWKLSVQITRAQSLNNIPGWGGIDAMVVVK
ncbi:hypothetical protein CBS147339_377 [Penicillium roqueforti]|nr:hypothetical protein CBS147354_48 [Penicillium roqueforti]KAI3086533.1 hypothetical protein CBS147339_377 [Penicillium roqueforti]KAI3107591.1 hypothetical protein CBS147338_505 [Penicillium roqueforti]KAI3115118.1 hypothetical protein CBS147333_1515 [Penicillium roqueforti]KAI3193225.1 hypothetical protein DTO032C6_415 [Penicillium roqueforti]